MSLQETLEEQKAELEKALEREAKELEAAVEETKPEVDDSKPEETKPEEKPVEPEKAPEEAKKTPAQWAQERREAVAAARLAKDLEASEAKIQALEQGKDQPSVDAEPNKLDDPQAWTEWKLRNNEKELAETRKKVDKLDNWTEEQTKKKQAEDLHNRALNEVQMYEAEVRHANPDYDQARSYYANMLAASMKIVNPSISNDQLVTAVNNRMMSRAAELLNQGHANPVKAMYEEAKNLGYRPAIESNNDNGKEEKVVKPDLAKVASNRSRNAGTAGAQGDGGRGEITLAYAAGLTNAEFSKLPAADKKRLFGG